MRQGSKSSSDGRAKKKVELNIKLTGGVSVELTFARFTILVRLAP